MTRALPAGSDNRFPYPKEELSDEYLARFSPASLTAEQYDESIRRLQETGGFPPEGLDYHVCFGSDGNLRVSEIWDSREQLQSFGERLMPILSEVGIEAGEPELLEIHSIVKR